MAQGDLGVIDLPGFKIGVAEGSAPGIWTPLIVDAGILSGRRTKTIQLPGGTISLAETGNAGYYGLITMSVADASGRAWKLVDIGGVEFTFVLTTVANENSAREYGSPVSWNDDSRVSKADIATCLNRTTALAGYVVGNPEARWAAAQKRSAKRWRMYREALRREEEMRETARVQAAERAEATRQQALAKLTAAEREALGLSPSPSSKGDA